ncbi:phosphate/phosphite/phosphonate ABC transporter substrate-binding protein [Hydrogenovibrio kuenenii]|uniref:phosphate/phosphite/phosphonate ABC transporter substrate-binding protein n=1 Tax=Hydrogenovibrio kuenenii TaxID=63658 RepID=UPI000463C98C|nr:phosphate/phosphite/phosphonate ABC transporter substrate-binding protein [Hydrogenovibrio kuenenii]
MSIVRKTYVVFTLFVFTAFLLLFGCDRQHDSQFEPLYSQHPPLKKDILLFGVHPLHNPKRLFEVYQPMIDYINQHLNGVKLRLEASRSYSAFNKKLFSGHFDFALPNPYQTVKATEHGYRIFGKMGDDNNFRGIILVRKDSNIEKVSDLKGKTICYPAPTALAATMMPQWYLYQHGIDVNKDIKNLYVGSQESSIMNVYLGKAAAAATWPPPWQAFIKQRPEVAQQVEVKWQTPPLPNNGLVVKNDIPEALVKQVSQVIFNLQNTAKGKKILQRMELSRFEPASNQTYDSVRVFLKKFAAEVRPIR